MQGKATVTVEVQTYWGYKTTRTFELTPGPDWAEKAAAELKRACESIDRDEVLPVYLKMDNAVLSQLERIATNERMGE